MILAIILVWLLGSAAFFGSLAYLASRPFPTPDYQFEAEQPQPEPTRPQWQKDERTAQELVVSTV